MIYSSKSSIAFTPTEHVYAIFLSGKDCFLTNRFKFISNSTLFTITEKRLLLEIFAIYLTKTACCFNEVNCIPVSGSIPSMLMSMLYIPGTKVSSMEPL